MKRKKVLKSLAELSAEVIGTETVRSEETKPQPKTDTERLRQVPGKADYLEVSADIGYHHGGLNE